MKIRVLVIFMCFLFSAGQSFALTLDTLYTKSELEKETAELYDIYLHDKNDILRPNVESLEEGLGVFRDALRQSLSDGANDRERIVSLYKTIIVQNSILAFEIFRYRNALNNDSLLSDHLNVSANNISFLYKSMTENGIVSEQPERFFDTYIAMRKDIIAKKIFEIHQTMKATSNRGNNLSIFSFEKTPSMENPVVIFSGKTKDGKHNCTWTGICNFENDNVACKSDNKKGVFQGHLSGYIISIMQETISSEYCRWDAVDKKYTISN